METIIALFIMGFLGTGHCMGMCSPVALAFSSSSSSEKTNWLHVLCIHLGRILAYVSLGFVVAALVNSLESFKAVQAYLHIFRYFAAFLLIFVAFYVVGWWSFIPWIERVGKPLWRWVQPTFREHLPPKTVKASLICGYFWGFLPCGLVYSAILIAATSGSDLFEKVAGMLAFGLGTTWVFLLITQLSQHVQRIRHTPIWKISTFSLLMGTSLWMFYNEIHVDHSQHHSSDGDTHEHHHHHH
ncbi:MAG: sulfite exporter TauE/SafE family protein [Pseudomonadota bacterium]